MVGVITMRLVNVTRVCVLAAVLINIGACKGNGSFFSNFNGSSGGFGGFGGISGTGGFGGTGGVGGFSGFGFDAGFGVDGGAGNSGPWISPFPNMGAPGFRTSTDTLCADVNVDENAIDVWSDSRGVFALVTGAASGPVDLDAGTSVCEFGACPSERLFHHDGKGWRLQSWTPLARPGWFDAIGLRGASAGPLFARHTADLLGNGACAITRYEGSTTSCEGFGSGVESLFVVNATLAYAVASGRLVTYDGSTWSYATFAPNVSRGHVWADTSNMLLLSGDLPFRVQRMQNGGTLTALGGPSSGRDASAIWASSADDIWVGGNDSSIWHFDGQAWQKMGELGGVTCMAATPIRGIWGNGESLFVYSATALQRWNGAAFETLANWSCGFGQSDTEIQDLWGNNESEVFIGLRDLSGAGVDRDTCGGAIVLRFDGLQFHRM
jgi:hypothetical protein